MDEDTGEGTGDDAGFDAFVAARWTALVTTAYLVTGDRALAEDCAQDALVRLHRRRRRVRVERRAAFADRAVMKAALSLRRRRRIAAVPFDVALREVGHGDGDPAGADPRLLAALRTLPPRARVAVVLRVVEDRSAAQTAEILGCTVGAVERLTAPGLAALHGALGDPPGPAGIAGIDLRDRGIREGGRA